MNWDKIGSALSGICVIHCILTPLALAFFPFLGVALASGESLEWAFIGFSVVIAVFALVQGYVYHKKPIPYILATVGFGTFIFAKLTFDKAFTFSVFTSSFVYVVAGLSIILAHYLNHKFTNHAKCSCKHDIQKTV